jgi:hypothetical protein
MIKSLSCIFGSILIGGFARYLYDYNKPTPVIKRETDLERLINGNNRYMMNKLKNSSNSRILVIKQFSGLNPKVIFDSPYIDVVNSPVLDHDILKIIENMFYEYQYDTIVILDLKNENNQQKEFLQELLYESKFLQSLIESKQLKPYWSSYDSFSGKVTFHHLFDAEQNKVI